MREREEDIIRQEGSWREEEKIRKPQEESEEKNKTSQMVACMNKEQQVSEDQQSAKAAMEHVKEKERVHTVQRYIENLSDSLSS